MRKTLCWALILGLLLAVCGAAAGEEAGAGAQGTEETAGGTVAESAALEEPRRTMMLDGKVVPGETIVVLAPFGGTVETLAAKAGDFVTAGQRLMTLGTTKVYAPADGTVGSLRAEVGDDVAYVQDRYGALMYVEPVSTLTITTTTESAYVADENYLIHSGETVYIGSRTNNKRVGVGFVTKVDGSSYTVEVTESNLIVGDSVSIFRGKDLAPKTKIGQGDTARSADVAITSEGTVFRLHVQQGDTVKRGDLLLETVGGATAYNPMPTNQVLAEKASIVATIDVSEAGSVTKNQVILTLYPLESLQVSVDVLEGDLPSIRIGDSVRIELASFYGQDSMTGKIAAISGLSSSATDEASYTVTIDFTATELIRMGMSVNVYFNE